MDRAATTRVLPWVLLAALVLGAGGLLLSLTAGIGFVSDEWNLLFLRPGWSPDAFLEPFHEHIIIAPAFLYKLLQTTFGMGSNRPFQVLAIAGFLTVGLLLFIWMRRRTGDWAALIGVAAILFLGAAFEDLLWAFQIGYFGSLACGLGALIALDRDDRRGDIAATLLLVLSISFSSLGMPFVAGAAVEWLSNPRGRRRRWVIPASAVGAYVLWWLGWGHEAESAISIGNLPDAPRFMFDAASSGVTSLLGLATGDGSEPDQPHLVWGRIGLVLLIGLSAWRLWRLGRIPSGVIVTGAIAIAFFGLAALGQNDLRLPTSSRYQLPGAIFLLLFLAEILRGIELKPPVLAGAAVVVLVTSLMGVDLMKEQADSRWVPASTSTGIWLGTIAYAGDSNDPSLVIDLGPGSEVPVDRFLDEIDASGPPGYSPGEIESSSSEERARADQMLVQLTGVSLVGVDPGGRFRRCERHPAGAAVPIDAEAGTVALKSLERRNLNVGLSRFGDPPGQPLGSLYSDAVGWLELPVIDSPPAWKVTGDGPYALCYR